MSSHPAPELPTAPQTYTRGFRASFWRLQLVGWSGYGLLHFTTGMADGKPLAYGGASLALAVCGHLVTSLLRLGFLRIRGLPSPPAVCACTLLFFLAVAAQTWFDLFFTLPFCARCNIDSLLDYVWYFASTFQLMLSWSALYFGIRFARQYQQQKLLALQAGNAAREAQLRMLRYQVNPHFLFNTLNAISTLILDEQSDTAYRMVGNLAAFLRHSLDADPVQSIALAHEVDAIRLYLAIEQARFGDRLKVVMDIDDDAKNVCIPGLILQPLVENAMKHAISTQERGGELRLSARCVDGMLLISVRDDGPGLQSGRDAATPRIGLDNVRERLQLAYGAQQRMIVRNIAPHGVEVELRIPYSTGNIDMVASA